jgi:hypothetical protein
MAVGAKSDHLNGMVAPPHGTVMDVVYLKKGIAILIYVVGLAGAQWALALTTASDQHGLDGC